MGLRKLHLIGVPKGRDSYIENLVLSFLATILHI